MQRMLSHSGKKFDKQFPSLKPEGTELDGLNRHDACFNNDMSRQKQLEFNQIKKGVVRRLKNDYAQTKQTFCGKSKSIVKDAIHDFELKDRQYRSLTQVDDGEENEKQKHLYQEEPNAYFTS